MLVKCISKEKPSLTFGKIYEVNDIRSRNYFTALNDWNQENEYFTSRFVVIKMYPNIPFFRNYLGEYKEYKGMIYGSV